MSKAAPMLTEPLNTSWHHLAVCRDEDETLFYHPEQERGEARRDRAEQAKAICRTCPAMLLCRDDARARRETHGTWGGEDEDERAAWIAGARKQERRERRRQMPTEPKAEPKPKGHRITDGTPCLDCGDVMRTRRAGRNVRADLAPGEVFHRARGICDTCHWRRVRPNNEFRWAITEIGADMTLAELTAEAIRTGRLDDAAEQRGVQVRAGDMTWRLDAQRGQLVATGPARALEVAA